MQRASPGNRAEGLRALRYLNDQQPLSDIGKIGHDNSTHGELDGWRLVMALGGTSI